MVDRESQTVIMHLASSGFSNMFTAGFSQVVVPSHVHEQQRSIDRVGYLALASMLCFVRGTKESVMYLLDDRLEGSVNTENYQP